MTLPGSGPISLGQVNSELGRSSNANININDSAVRSLAGKPNGAISMGDLRGKSAVWWDYPSGLYEFSSYGSNAAEFTLTCSKPCVWTYTVTGLGHTQSIASGGTSTYLRMVVTPVRQGLVWGARTATWNVTATVDGKSSNWQMQGYAEGSA